MLLDVFLEAFLTRLVPIFHEVTLTALRNFDLVHYPLPAMVGAVGALSASLLLYLLGRWLRRWPERVSTDEQRARIEAMRAAAGSWLPWLLVLSPTPVGAIIIVAAGFFSIRPRVAAAAIIAAEIAWRTVPYWR
ncbi:MAG: hypothetical protein V4735_07800 [Pseudomonadota bacterium]